MRRGAVTTMTDAIFRKTGRYCAAMTLLLVASVCQGSPQQAQTTLQTSAAIDRDLAEVTIPRLESLYQSHKYTVTQVMQWYLDRIARYDGVYKAFLHVEAAGALATAAAEDAAAKSGGQTFQRGPLW